MCELDGHPGPLRDRLSQAIGAWRDLLRTQIEIARESGDLSADLDPTDAVTMLSGLAMAANQAIELLGDDPEKTGARTRRLMHASLGLDGTT